MEDSNTDFSQSPETKRLRWDSREYTLAILCHGELCFCRKEDLADVILISEDSCSESEEFLRQVIAGDHVMSLLCDVTFAKNQSKK